MRSIFSFIQGLFDTKNYTLHNIILFVIVLMCIQYIPIETRAGVSPVKVAVMCVMPIILLARLQINKAFMAGTAYVIWLFITGFLLHPATFRASTIMYATMFVITFVVVYTAVWNYQVVTLQGFRYFLRTFFYVLVGFLIAQQICIIVGIKLMPLLNLCQIFNRGIGANSLTFEPSTLGRLLAVIYYALLKCTEYLQGSKVHITEIFKGDLKWVSILYIWSVVTMGSGTAFIAAGILSLYFMHGRYIFLSIPVFIGVYFLLEYIGNESFTRAQRASIATMTGDADEVRETDGSAAMRIAPMLNTLNADFTDGNFWIGNGCDSTSKYDVAIGKALMGHINDYGFISYILELIIIFSCCMHFKSLGTLFFFTGTGGGIGNISYGWGLLMIFTVVRYFYDNLDNEEIYDVEEEYDYEMD